MQGIKDRTFGFDLSMIRKFGKYILPLLAIIGILLSVELTLVYYNANFVAGAASSFCSFNDSIDCDGVAKTQFSHFLGIPLSIYGLFFYIAILKLSIFPYFKSIKLLNVFKNPKSYIFSLSSVAIIVSIALAWISSTQIHKICILCYMTYFLNIFILFASKSGKSFIENYKITVKDAINILSKPIYMVITIVLAVILGIGVYFANSSKIFIPKNPVQSSGNQYSGINGSASVNGNVLGSRNPKLIIHEYTDFECPYCGMSNEMLHRLVQEVDGVQVVHHDYPLDNKCNSAIKRPVHVGACKVALYSRAAKKQGKYWEFNTLLFENQQNLKESNVLNLAKSLKLDTKKMNEYVADPASMQQLKNDVNKANQLGVQATPTYFIGMKKYEGLMPYPELKQIVLENLK